MAHLRKTGEAAFSKVEKINSELFSLTYGAIVTQLLKDYEEVDATNEQLEKMGYNIGIRLVDEFLAKAQITACQHFSETAEVIAKVGFKMFLGVSAEVVNSSEREFSLQMSDNPLAEFVELPEQYNQLAYSNMLCGVLRGWIACLPSCTALLPLTRFARRHAMSILSSHHGTPHRW
uniref:Trafficking protein particle complex subunit n=1 Tax=Haptolina ericina TaxID=156174 RepID=A0A7S3AQI4_9EUKA|mmetsp:Transcript_29373/g.66471  ORF Transcript_29373/g.66471 Transcript_29373/m.66471 type:complete len:176 (+) Transcript_29373:22-549(+)